MSTSDRGECLEAVNSQSPAAPVSRGLDTYETVDDCKKEHTYAAVKNTTKMSRPDRGESFTREEEAVSQTRPEDGYSPELDATKKLETHGVPDVNDEKQKENKAHVYAVVHRDGRGKVSRASCQAKAARCSLKDDGSLDPANRSSSVSGSPLSSVQSVDRMSSVNPVDRSSSAIETGLNTNEAVPEEDALAGDKIKNYLYAVVDKTNKKKRPPQVPGHSSYASLVKFKQGAQDSAKESTVVALHLSQPNEEPSDEPPIYNVPAIHSLMSQIEQKPSMTAIPSCAMKNCRAGINLEGWLEIKWRIHVSAGDIVKQGCQAG
ncbi:uncharacterized protein LOC144654129 [Oculina patagonica]